MATLTRPTERRARPRAERRPLVIDDRLRKVLIYLVLIAVCLIVLFPIYWMVTISIKTEVDQFAVPPLWLGFTPDPFRLSAAKPSARSSPFSPMNTPRCHGG